MERPSVVQALTSSPTSTLPRIEFDRTSPTARIVVQPTLLPSVNQTMKARTIAIIVLYY